MARIRKSKTRSRPRASQEGPVPDLDGAIKHANDLISAGTPRNKIGFRSIARMFHLKSHSTLYHRIMNGSVSRAEAGIKRKALQPVETDSLGDFAAFMANLQQPLTRLGLQKHAEAIYNKTNPGKKLSPTWITRNFLKANPDCKFTRAKGLDANRAFCASYTQMEDFYKRVSAVITLIKYF